MFLFSLQLKQPLRGRSLYFNAKICVIERWQTEKKFSPSLHFFSRGEPARRLKYPRKLFQDFRQSKFEGVSDNVSGE